MITDKLSQQAAFCVLPREYARPGTAAQYADLALHPGDGSFGFAVVLVADYLII
jgi:hypothetical protein